MPLRDYQTVDERLREWWSNHPYGRILTRIAESHGDQRWTVIAEVYRDPDDERPCATGMAYGDPAGSSGAQATNPLEDAETSAIGRALANAGYSPKGARPSAEEMAVAQNRQGAPEPTSEPSGGEAGGKPCPACGDDLTGASLAKDGQGRWVHKDGCAEGAAA